MLNFIITYLIIGAIWSKFLGIPAHVSLYGDQRLIFCMFVHLLLYPLVIILLIWKVLNDKD